MKEPVINIKDLLAECVRKAGLVICLGVVCAVVLCGFKFYKDTKALNNATQSNEDEAVTEEIELTDEDNKLVLDYVNLVNQKEALLEYFKESIYVNCNPYDVDYIQMQYYVESSTGNGPMDEILAIRTYVLGGGLASDLHEKDDSIEPKYYQELLRCTSASYDSYQDCGLFEITMYAASEEQAQTFKGWVDECLQAYFVKINDAGMVCDVEKVSEECFSTTFASIMYDRDNKKNVYKELETQIKSLESDLSAEQLTVAKAMLVKADEKDETVENTEDENASNEKPQVSISKKFLVLGGAIGIVLAVALIAVNYIFFDTIQSPMVLKEVYRLRKLGEVQIKKQTVFDKLADKLFYNKREISQADEIKLLSSKIQLLCERDGIKEIALVGGAYSEAAPVVEELVRDLKEKNISLEQLEDICIDLEDFISASKIKKVILVEALGKTKYGEVDEILALCEENEIDVLGYAVWNV